MIRTTRSTAQPVEHPCVAAEGMERTARPGSADWAGAWEGAREVLMTVAATLAIGFAWAAIEMGRIGAEPAPAGASSFETGYDGAMWTGR